MNPVSPSAASIRCLVVEDNPSLNRDLLFYLNSQGINTTGVMDGKAMDLALQQQAYDVVILDLGLPGEDGLSIASRLSANRNLGLIILTARDILTDRLAGWESGAHVYLVKPVPLEEITAVINSVYRRLNPAPVDPQSQAWRFYPLRRELISPLGATIPLTFRERLLINAMAEAPQQYIPRDMVLEQDTGGAIDALIHRLRRKLKQHGDPIRTVYGEGFVFEGELALCLPENN
ncbi:response regulator transcription factor [Oceanobacter mangrovi]|uniref:response regulator transcription factor n=1 Tax=Oceanobacter mangrovi TaxID=2862510 RepID=UPI001C8EE0EE|nr:response regulator transcription factor [Oceanobacter mangrovi]